MAKLKSKQEIIASRSHGLKYVDQAVAIHGSMKAVIDNAIEISKEFPDTWGPNRWHNFDWAFGNAIRDHLKYDVQTFFNLDEALNDEEIKYVAEVLNIEEPYKPFKERAK